MMEFIGFLILLVIGMAVVLILTNFLKLKIELPGGLITSIIVGYIGARLGMPLFGNWRFLAYEHISILPAILGAIVILVLVKSALELVKK